MHSSYLKLIALNPSSVQENRKEDQQKLIDNDITGCAKITNTLKPVDC